MGSGTERNCILWRRASHERRRAFDRASGRDASAKRAEGAVTRKFVWTLSTLLMVLLVLEAALRIRDRAIGQISWSHGLMTSDETRGWVGRPLAARWVHTGEYAVFVENDERGHRRPAPLPTSQPNRRVIVLGGSTAWGRGVGRGHLLTDWLRRERPGVSFLNRAIDGYWLESIERTLRHSLAEGPCDVVVLVLSEVDAALQAGPDDTPSVWLAVEDRSRAARFLVALWQRLRLETPRPDAPPDAWAGIDESLSAIAGDTRRAGARLVLVYAPSPRISRRQGGRALWRRHSRGPQAQPTRSCWT